MYSVLFDDGAHSIELDTFDNITDARSEFHHQVNTHDGTFGEFELVRLDNQGDYDYTIQYHRFTAEWVIAPKIGAMPIISLG